MIRGRHTTLTRPLQYLALAAFMVFLAFPVVFLLVTALKPQSELLDPDPSFLPKEIEWSNFTKRSTRPGSGRPPATALSWRP